MKIALQQSIIPDYRLGLFLLLREQWGDQFEVYAGDADFGGSPVSTEEAWDHFERVQNVFFGGGRFLWQWGSFRQLLSADVAILNGNMRMLSNNVLLVLRKLLGRRTVLWGHAEGQSRLAGLLRGSYLRFCDGFIAYTESQAETLRTRDPWLKVWVAANSCISATDCVPVEAALEEVDSFLYVGRLVKEKKVQLLLDGFIEAREQGLLSNSARLVYVGDGAERSQLETRAKLARASSKVVFAGHISSVQELRCYYRRAVCSVSPGYVGLSATQSFSFGVSMLVAKDEFHSPEIEACKEGFNARFFTSNKVSDLARQMEQMYEERRAWIKKRPEISARARDAYSFEVMRDAFFQAVKEVS